MRERGKVVGLCACLCGRDKLWCSLVLYSAYLTNARFLMCGFH